jgi:hypothetical protein
MSSQQKISKNIYLTDSILALIFRSIHKNILSNAAKFVRVLRCPKNGLLNVLGYVSATIFVTPCPQPNFLVRNAG